MENDYCSKFTENLGGGGDLDLTMNLMKVLICTIDKYIYNNYKAFFKGIFLKYSDLEKVNSIKN